MFTFQSHPEIKEEVPHSIMKDDHYPSQADKDLNRDVDVQQNKVGKGLFGEKRWSRTASILSVIVGLIGLIGAGYTGIHQLKKSIDHKIAEEAKPYKEMLTAVFAHQGSSSYVAAIKLEKLYRTMREKESDKDLLTSVVHTLLESVANCYYQEEYIATVETIINDNLVSLQEKNLHDIGFIYLMVGDLEKAEDFLQKSLSRVEKGNLNPKHTRAITHWRLALMNLAKGSPEGSISHIRSAQRLDPKNFDINTLGFKTIKDARDYVNDDPGFERILQRNPDLIQDLVKLSKALEKINA